jgi:2-keto-3-deoxy-L-rhamnonate aldolase RhmA
MQAAINDHGEQALPTASTIRQAIASGRTIRGAHLLYPAPRIVEVLAALRLDYLYLDGEHGYFSGADLAQHAALAESLGMTPIARVPENARATITHFLDRGVRGIIVPHVESVAAARRAVEATYFAPLGDRSYGGAFPPGRDKSGLGDFLTDCNDRVTLSVMIESRAGIEAAEAIAAVDGIDYLSFGMMDVAQQLGHPGRPDHPAVQEAVAATAARIRAAGKPIREDFMRFAWIDEIVHAGALATIGPASKPS